MLSLGAWSGVTGGRVGGVLRGRVRHCGGSVRGFSPEMILRAWTPSSTLKKFTGGLGPSSPMGLGSFFCNDTGTGAGRSFRWACEEAASAAAPAAASKRSASSSLRVSLKEATCESNAPRALRMASATEDSCCISASERASGTRYVSAVVASVSSCHRAYEWSDASSSSCASASAAGYSSTWRYTSACCGFGTSGWGGTATIRGMASGGSSGKGATLEGARRLGMARWALAGRAGRAGATCSGRTRPTAR
mmetsp:Transcript_1129/g.2339  ORF Transcript_1129/g.2339 Transcript_1129/m.2339 type:complete len:250 (-) Transcript_1129:1485-2234(-)